MKKLILSLVFVCAMGFYVSPAISQESVEPGDGDVGGTCQSQSIGDSAYMLCDYKKKAFSTNCKEAPGYTCLLRGDQPNWPDLPSIP
jgi:hypothetical protein